MNTTFLRQLRARHTEPLTVIWDNVPAHRGDVVRAYLTTPQLRMLWWNPVSSTGQALPSCSPDFQMRLPGGRVALLRGQASIRFFNLLV